MLRIPTTPTVLVLLSAATACGPDPEHEKTVDYLTELHPVLLENSLLAERVLVQAAHVYNKDAQADEIASAWATEVLPIAESIPVLANEVQPPPHLSVDHNNLVDIWSKRADAYREVVEGLQTADRSRFDAASNATAAITLSEDQWVRAFNAKIEPLRLYVDLYP
jgi:hypothetical protein